MRFAKTSLAVSVSLALTACGGGGGGGGGGALNTGWNGYNSHFTRVGSVKPLSGTGAVATETALVSQNIDGTGGDELILVGRQNPERAIVIDQNPLSPTHLQRIGEPALWENFDITIWGWSGGTLVDKTSQWFSSSGTTRDMDGVFLESGVSRRITGVEEEVKFGDFDGDGHKDMYAGPYTDTPLLRAGYELSSSSGAVFFNSGSSSFNARTNIVLESNTHAHASAIADLDGAACGNPTNAAAKCDDIWSTAGGSSTVLLGNGDRTFLRLPVSGSPQAGGTGVAVADFTALGTKGVILTEQATSTGCTSCATATATVSGGVVTGLTLVNGGDPTAANPRRYNVGSIVGLIGGGGRDAYGRVDAVDGDGRITGISVVDGGSGYSSTPTVIFGSNSNLYSYRFYDNGIAIPHSNARLHADEVRVTQVSVLPQSRFQLPRWAGQGFTGGHEVRVLADIQLSSGLTASSQGAVSDAVIISRANQYDVGHAQAGQWPELSEIQFLKNNGSGTFTDITDTVLLGYDHNTMASYNASFKDVNGDGRLDIILPGNSWTSNSGAQILMRQSATNAYGFVYQASYATVLKAFQDGAKSLESNANFTANGVALIQDPSGTLYVATAVGTGPVTDANNVVHYSTRTIYITPLNGLTFNQTRAAIEANWPWLTSSQVDSIMSQSTRTYLNLSLLDPTLALSPQNGLNIPTASGLKAITGSISGLKLGDSANSLKVQDGFGRAFEMDYSSTRSDQLNLWSNRLDENDDSARTLSIADNLRFGQADGFRYGASDDNKTRIFGMPNYRLTNNLSGTWQFANLAHSPWMSLSGSWGNIRSTNTVEGTLSWSQAGWTVRGGAMRTTTELDPGLVTRVNPITAVWADVGYRHDGWSASVGTLPKIVDGSAELTLPTSVDNRGRVQYTNMTVGFDNPLVGFARLGYQGSVTKNTSLRVNGMASTNDAYTVKMEVKSTW